MTTALDLTNYFNDTMAKLDGLDMRLASACMDKNIREAAQVWREARRSASMVLSNNPLHWALLAIASLAYALMLDFAKHPLTVHGRDTASYLNDCEEALEDTRRQVVGYFTRLIEMVA